MVTVLGCLGGGGEGGVLGGSKPSGSPLYLPGRCSKVWRATTDKQSGGRGGECGDEEDSYDTVDGHDDVVV